MKSYRIGNNVDGAWAIKSNGNPFDLTGQNLTLVAKQGCHSEDVPCTVNTNVVSFTYYGKDQKYTGIYVLELWINKGLSNQHVLDTCEAFELVPYSCLTGGADGTIDTSTTLELTSDLEVIQIEPATVTIGNVTTLASGSAPTVSNSGTNNSAILNFGIPKGSQLFPGTAVTDTTLSVVIDGALVGDYYINTSTLKLYQYSQSGTTKAWIISSEVLSDAILNSIDQTEKSKSAVKDLTNTVNSLCYGLFGIIVEDGALIVVENVEGSAFQSGSVSDDGSLSLSFVV